jgi:diguanylate cyclase (GGDEF)-like protein/PAS domain S-box-containing protein
MTKPIELSVVEVEAMAAATETVTALQAEVAYLRERLASSDATLRAIRDGEVDAVVVSATRGDERIFTLTSADRPYRTFVENMPGGAATVSADGIVLYANVALAELLVSTDNIVGHHVRELVTPESWETLTQIVAPANAGTVEALLLTSADDVVPVRISSSVWQDERGADVTCLVVTDLTRERLAEAALAHLAQHDSLTGLPNRTLLADRIQHALDQRAPDGGLLAVLFCDVDGFKNVNDGYGHGAGDQLLRTIGERLTSAVRPADTVARIGGDEFVVLIDFVTGIEDIAAVAARISAAVAMPILAGPVELEVTVSIGISVASPMDPNVSPESLLHDADAAMYKAKRQGPNIVELFDDALRATASTRLRVLTEIRHAAGDGQLRLYYQPVFRLDVETPVGVEALVRWEHPTRGLVPPDDFIPLAESSGLMPTIGAWVAAEACRQASKWSGDDDVDAPQMAINVSGRQLTKTSGLIESVRGAIEDTGIDPQRLVLEVTESALLADAEVALAVVNELKSFGLRIAIDDFGIGYSSLLYLKRFPVDILKIDKSFVKGLGRERADLAIVRSVIELALAFGIDAVAEGIETREQLGILQDLGCSFGQGWLWSPALPAPRLSTYFGGTVRACTT